MAALTTLFPVFFMLALGYVARVREWVTPVQKSGANEIIFRLLFPLLILDLMCTAQLEMESIQIIGYVFIVLVLGIFLGKLITPKMCPEYQHFAPYLLSAVEGGNVALPLYLSIVGTSSNTVIFDIAGTAVTFILCPILIARETAKDATFFDMLKSIFSNSFVLAVMLGLFLNLSGIYGILTASSFGPMIENTLDQATAPIVSLILFILGYDLMIDKETIVPIVKLMGVKIIYFSLVIVGFFLFFPGLMADKVFMMAVLIYFMCPTGFGMMPVIRPLFRKDELGEGDGAFTSAFVSIFMIVTLVVYTGVVVFIA